MNPNTRYLECVRGNPVDQVPILMEGFAYATREDLAAEPDEKKREIAERLFDSMPYMHRHSVPVNRTVMTPPDRIRLISEAPENGNVIKTHEVDTPKGVLTAIVGRNKQSNTGWHIKHAVESMDDIEKIRSVPWERPESLKAPDPEDTPPGFEERGIRRLNVSTPMVCVAGAMPREFFLELCLTDFDVIRELTEICFERMMDVLDVALSNRVIDYVWIGGSEWVTPPMASPELYYKLVQPYEDPMIRRIHEAGALAHVHCHGNVSEVLDWVVERGTDFFEPVEPPPDGDITFEEAKNRVAGRMTLGGNVEARVLEHGSVEEVTAAAHAAFQGSTQRMVLRNSANPISEMNDTMLRNYHALIDVWEAERGK